MYLAIRQLCDDFSELLFRNHRGFFLEWWEMFSLDCSKFLNPYVFFFIKDLVSKIIFTKFKKIQVKNIVSVGLGRKRSVGSRFLQFSLMPDVITRYLIKTDCARSLNARISRFSRPNLYPTSRTQRRLLEDSNAKLFKSPYPFYCWLTGVKVWCLVIDVNL